MPWSCLLPRQADWMMDKGTEQEGTVLAIHWWATLHPPPTFLHNNPSRCVYVNVMSFIMTPEAERSWDFKLPFLGLLRQDAQLTLWGVIRSGTWTLNKLGQNSPDISLGVIRRDLPKRHDKPHSCSRVVVTSGTNINTYNPTSSQTRHLQCNKLSLKSIISEDLTFWSSLISGTFPKFPTLETMVECFLLAAFLAKIVQPNM